MLKRVVRQSRRMDGKAPGVPLGENTNYHKNVCRNKRKMESLTDKNLSNEDLCMYSNELNRLETAETTNFQKNLTVYSQNLYSSQVKHNKTSKG